MGKKNVSKRCGSCLVPGERSCHHEPTDSQVCGLYEADGCICVELARVLEFLELEETPENVEKVLYQVEMLMAQGKVPQKAGKVCPLKEAMA